MGVAESVSGLPNGQYYLKELSTGGKYVLDLSSYPVKVTRGSGTAPVTLTPNGGLPISNALKRGSISGTVIDGEGNGIDGIKVGLFPEGETDLSEHNAIVIDLTENDGKYLFEDVPFGNWQIAELKDDDKEYAKPIVPSPAPIHNDGENNTLNPIESAVKKSENASSTISDPNVPQNPGSSGNINKGNSSKENGSSVTQSSSPISSAKDTNRDNSAGGAPTANPQTGDMNPITVVAVFAVLVLLVAFLWLAVKRRKK